MRKGITRVVFPVGRWVIKFPRLGVGQINFLLGCLGNLRERQKTKWGIWGDLISPCIWCSWGGLIGIQKKVDVLTVPLSDRKYEKFKILTSERKPGNFGYLEGKIVCIDYGGE